MKYALPRQILVADDPGEQLVSRAKRANQVATDFVLYAKLGAGISGDRAPQVA